VLIAEARVTTDRSSRYLVQLCRHVHHIAQVNPQLRAHVEWSDEHGLLDFGWGRCAVRAERGALVLRAEARDEDGLRELERRIADRVEQIGRRDGLTVTWTPPQRTTEQLPG
jgi:hypothetical protein